MRITIERLRALVLIVGVLLVLSIGIFLALSRFHGGLKAIDIPTRLGINITQQANHVVYMQSHAGHTLFKIDAAKVVQVKAGKSTLSDATIDLYGTDGSRVDQIKGKEFEYDQRAGLAKAVGSVEITMMRPGVAPAIAPNATPLHVAGEKRGSTLLEAASAAEQSSIHVITSGLVFNQKSGVASTKERLQYSMAQGAGSAVGASFDSQLGRMVLDQSVELRVRRGTETVNLLASHAVFDRDSKSCNLRDASFDLKESKATASEATIHFREDGSVIQLDATHGLTVATNAGSQIRAPHGRLEFDEKNHPRSGVLDGGVVMQSSKDGQTFHGSSSTARLAFRADGQLEHAHLERQVELTSSKENQQDGIAVRQSRRWQSPVAEIEFRSVGRKHPDASNQPSSSQLEIASIHGTGGVVVVGDTQRGSAPAQTMRLSAEEVDGRFDQGQSLRHLVGTQHALIEETTETGIHRSAIGDRLEATLSALLPDWKQTNRISTDHPKKNRAESNIESAILTGHVVIVQTDGQKIKGNSTASPLRATAGRAEYDGAGEWVHLTLAPRVEDGALQMSAERMDLSRVSGNAFAHGNVKTTWMQANATSSKQTEHVSSGLGGQGPTHLVAAEAELHQSTEDAIFRGQARIWQGANSIAAPTITLNRNTQTLLAEQAAPTHKVELVHAVFLSATTEAKSGAKQNATPQLIRLSGAEFKYSAIDRKAWMHGVAGEQVVTETAGGRMISDTVEMVLQQKSSRPSDRSSQIDHLVAQGNVELISEDRRGTGAQVTYTGATGVYVLTGTDTARPKLSDPERGTVVGDALIFNSQDDSVSVEGVKQKTITETRTPK